MDETQKHYTKWKNSGTKDYILYNTIYMKSLEKVIGRLKWRMRLGIDYK